MAHRALTDGHTSLLQAAVRVWDTSVLAITPRSDLGNDIKPELVAKQAIQTLAKRPHRLLGTSAVFVAAGSDLEQQP